ncbi:trp operon repressor [Pasteurellaceae bacterium TAE3-ERU1]|uniref:trp operon repressor n=1 Tax=Spirabiliibacterium mucosae TaxID=28156 RepID=UPI001AAD953D|nr:trp operon repressor [Spirabiliibacterium mucosae]MBE2898141.1 trp operon repressor [Spirabiliibacterium mucosae]MBV7387388.1 trp operon repressor [Pasteurellaceae bacterium TAE3-ERU1]
MTADKSEQWRVFVDLLRDAFREGREHEVLGMLLTADERDSIGLRVQIIKALLAKSHAQREIQQQLNTSAATITRGSNMLKTMPEELLNWLQGHGN